MKGPAVILIVVLIGVLSWRSIPKWIIHTDPELLNLAIVPLAGSFGSFVGMKTWRMIPPRDGSWPGIVTPEAVAGLVLLGGGGGLTFLLLHSLSMHLRAKVRRTGLESTSVAALLLLMGLSAGFSWMISLIGIYETR